MAGDGLLLYLLMSAGVILLAYAAMRYLALWQHGRMQGRRMRILEVLPVGRDRQLLLIAVGQEVLLVGTSPGGTHLVHRVADPAAVAELLSEEGAAAPGSPQPFPQALPAAGDLLQRLQPGGGLGRWLSGLIGRGSGAALDAAPIGTDSVVRDAEASIQANLDRMRQALKRDPGGDDR